MVHGMRGDGIGGRKNNFCFEKSSEDGFRMYEYVVSQGSGLRRGPD